MQPKSNVQVLYCTVCCMLTSSTGKMYTYCTGNVLCVDTVDRQDRIDATRTYCTLGLDVSVPGYCLGDEVVPYGTILYIIQIAIMLVQM